MKRDVDRLSDGVHDLCVIGGGIYGATVAWDATLRGLSVALIDKGDFGHATSSKSLRVIHGGFRSLRHGDIVRIREAIRERTMWMRIAPHLVHPLPFLIPTYRHSMKAKGILSLGLKVYDLIAFDRNRLDDPQKSLPPGRVISKQECLQLIPELDARDLTGAAIFYDGQMHNSERLLLSFVHSAAGAGAVAANYVEASGFLMDGDRVAGVRARDLLTENELDIRARMVVNTAGPWVARMLTRLDGCRPKAPFALSKAFNLVVNQFFSSTYAVGLHSTGSRLYFITPWHNRSLLGTAHLPYDGEPDEFRLHERDIQDFVGAINRARPSIPLRFDDIRFFHGGMVPAKAYREGQSDVDLIGEGRIVDHREDAGVEGMISVVGVKFTDARSMAEKAIDRVFETLGYKPPKSTSAEIPVHGGLIDRFDSFMAQSVSRHPYGLKEETVRHLVLNYGSAYSEVLRHAESDPVGLERVTDDSEVLKAEVLHGIRDEMAQKLADVVFRRTELGMMGHPGNACLETCATIMSEELGWDHTRTETEVKEVQAEYSLGNASA
jgi:glycerol-3-phosphate dehydrogenase